MINFFRKIRQKLLTENKFSRYLLYAIGEILLVVIGILIALQINNWNEDRKANVIGKQYLVGIKNDLERDLINVDCVLRIQSYNLSVLSSIDSIILRKYYSNTKQNSSLFIKPDSLTINYLFERNTSFRSVNGAYKSLIADGKSSLIKNKHLFQEI